MRNFQELKARAAAASLRLLGYGLGIYYTGLALAHSLVLSPEQARTMVPTAAVSAAVLFGVGEIGRRGFAARSPHAWTFAVSLVVLGNCALHLATAEDLIHSTNFALAIVGGGVLFLSGVPFAAYLVLAGGSWWAATATFDPGSLDAWAHWAFALAGACVLSIFAYRVRMSMLSETLRLHSSVDAAEAAYRAEQERRVLQEQASRAERLRSLGLMAGGIAHDFNNILVGVLGNATLALEEAEPDDKIRPLLHNIQYAAERAAELTQQILRYSGGGRFRVETIDLGEALRDGVQLLRSIVPAGVDLRIDLPETPLWISADPAQVHQIALNLVSNAVEAVGDRLGRVGVRAALVEVSAKRMQQARVGASSHGGAYAMLEVADDGPGIPASTRSEIFDPFYSTKEAGRGLGLATVSTVVRSCGGAIFVENPKTGGAALTVLFPLASSASAERAEALEDGVRESRVADPAVVVVADDDPTALSTAAAVLESRGHHVLRAVDGREAVELVRRFDADLLVIDIVMPNLSGSEAIEELKDFQGPIIAVSGRPRDSLELAVRKRISAFVSKPYTVQELDRAAAAVLDDRLRPGVGRAGETGEAPAAPAG